MYLVKESKRYLNKVRYIVLLAFVCLSVKGQTREGEGGVVLVPFKDII